LNKFGCFSLLVHKVTNGILGAITLGKGLKNYQNKYLELVKVTLSQISLYKIRLKHIIEYSCTSTWSLRWL